MENSTIYSSSVQTGPKLLFRRLLVAAVATTLLFLAGVSSSSFAAKGSPGKPGDGGGAAPDLGDLIILYRDDNGVPIPSPEVDVTDPETGETVDGGLCWQPIAFNVDTDLCPAECVVASEPGGTGADVVDVVSVNQYSCGVGATDPEGGAISCSGCTQETEFGRINAARSPAQVFDRQLEDVIVNLATADCRTIDPAGRLVATRVGDDLSVLVATIDSPLQNLAIYRQLMLTGTIGAPLPQGAGVLDTAARGLGAASDKSGQVNVDLVAYLNQIMGLTDPLTSTILPKLCETYREEVQGVIQLVEKCFLDYGNVPPNGSAYQYGRTTNFGALPAPPYIDDPSGAQNMPGWFEYLTVDVDDPIYPEFIKAYGPIQGAVFEGVGSDGSNIGAFAQASDDARAVISYMHSWQVPVDFETPVPCEPTPGDIAYDVLISDVSGLQVPRNVVDGSEGREFFLSVANASGSADPASGTVTVTAIPENGGTIEGSPWTFTFTDLAVGTTLSFPPTFFNVDLGGRTTINWTAVAVAEFDGNPTNNIVTAVSNVKVTGTGAGGGNSSGGQGGKP